MEIECPSCGRENKDDAAFCMSCGATLPDVPFSQLKKEEPVRPREGAAPAGPSAPAGAEARPIPETREEPLLKPAAEGTGAPATALPVPQAAQEPTVAMPASTRATPDGGMTAEEKTVGAGSQVTSPGGFVFNAGAAPPQAVDAQPQAAERPVSPAAPPPPTPPVEVPGVATGKAPKTAAPAPAPETQDAVLMPAPPLEPQAAPTTPAQPAQPPAAPPAAGRQSVVEEIGDEAKGPAAPIPAPPLEPQAAPPTPAQPAQPPAAPPAVEQIGEVAAPPKPEYYVPPEADYGMVAPRVEPPPQADQPIREEISPAVTPSMDSTQAVPPVVAAAAVAGRERRVICPECYAPNPEGNSYCQECGSALPITSVRQAAATRPAPGQPAYQQTAVLTPAVQTGAVAPAGVPTGAMAQPAYASPLPKAEKARGDKAFGVADVLALLGVGAAAIAIALSYVLESFTWKKGLDIAMFSHQGAYTQGRTDLLGGPGILPYEGAEFFTVGLMVAIGLALALVFLAVRVGRGPMYILAGCILFLPAAYLLFQAILPLRQMGIDVDPAVGLSGIFFGNTANPGVGPPMWVITGAGVLLILAGFIAPPRGWGRLFTFLLCFSIVLGAAFLCAACFNWNLFISQPSAAHLGAGPFLSRALLCLPVPLL